MKIVEAYKRITADQIEYHNMIFNKMGEGHQFIKEIEFGKEDEVEGRCTFEDYELNNYIISLGILENNIKADVYASIINMNDIEIS